MPVDSTPYQAIQQPPNPLTTLSTYVGLGNQLQQQQILRQQVQQEQIATELAQGHQLAAQIQAKHTLPNGDPDILGGLQEMGRTPLTARSEILTPYFNIAAQQSQFGNVGVVPQGQPHAGEPRMASTRQMEDVNYGQGQGSINAAPSQNNGGGQPVQNNGGGQPVQNRPQNTANSNDPFGGVATTPGGLAPAVQQQVQDRTKTNQQYITDTRAAAADAPNQITMIEKIKNLAKKVNTGPQAERINNFKAQLAELFGTDPTSPATYETLNKYMLANGLATGVANDANSQAIKLAYVASNPNTGILPSAVLPIADYQQSLYRQKMGEANGLEQTLAAKDQNGNLTADPSDPSRMNPGVEKYRATFRNNQSLTGNFYQFKNLKTTAEKQAYMEEHPGFSAEFTKMKNLKAAGALQ